MFILISGYFGIRHLLKPLLKLFIDLTVYGLIAYLVGVIFFGIDFSLGGLIHGIDIHNWFVVHFALLVLSAPILEASLQGRSSECLIKWIILLVIINVFFGYILGYVNTNGYNYLNFIMLYFIARYIRLIKEDNSPLYVHFKKFGLFYWIISAIILTLGIVILWKLGHVPNSVRYFGYNNPLILLSAFALFTYFSSIKIQSKTINTIATGMFGVFLMHTPPEIIPIRNHYSSLIFQDFGYGGLMLEGVCLFTILALVSIFVERNNKEIVKLIYGFIKK